MQFFVVGKIGPKRSVTPEGFVVCHDVAIARTGEQLYRPYEVPDTIKPAPGTDYVRVMRDADELFAPAAMASAEGKPITVDHPPGMQVTPSLFRSLSHGHIQNIRRGAGPQSNLMVCDMVVCTPEAIEMAQPGLEISMGYDAGYQELVDPNDVDRPTGRARQHDYVFNHAAFVPGGGRCGPECAIGDHSACDDHQQEQTMTTTTKDRRSAWDKLRAAFTSNDGKAFDALASELSAETAGTTGGENGIVIHNHLAPLLNATNDAVADPLKDAPDWFKAHAKTVDAKFAAIGKYLAADAKAKDDDDDDDDEKKKKEKEKAGDRKTKDADKEDDDEDEKKKAKDAEVLGNLEIEAPDGLTGDAIAKMTDSAFLEEPFSAVLASAEILAPGIRVPTFDAKAKPVATFDAICGTRRKALEFALKDTATSGMIEVVSNGNMIDTGKATCGDVRTVFNAVVAMKKASNNDQSTGRTGDRRTAGGGGDGKTPKIMTPADLNRFNAERYGRKAS